jgi:dephospho-CoA kinase
MTQQDDRAEQGRVADASTTPPADASEPAVETVVIGLTGPIGCGKSSIAGWLAERGAVVVDADAVAREVTEPGQPAHDAILERFGGIVRTHDGTLDRSGLAKIVFSDPRRLAELEAIVHPAVRPPILAAIQAARASGAPAVIVEAIKLVEGGLAAFCDEVWLITCSPTVQRDRVIDRGSAPEDADRRIAGQAGMTDRLRPAATRVIDTTGPIGDARARIAAAWADATRLSSSA